MSDLGQMIAAGMVPGCIAAIVVAAALLGCAFMLGAWIF